MSNEQQPKPDRRALTSALNGRSGGRRRTVEGGRVYSLSVPPDLYEFLRGIGPDEVRAALRKWQCERLVV